MRTLRLPSVKPTYQIKDDVDDDDDDDDDDDMLPSRLFTYYIQTFIPRDTLTVP